MSTVKIVSLKPSLCKGCLECERACSNVHHKNDKGAEWSAIRIVDTGNGYEMTNCNMCGLCVDMCPVMAIKRLRSGIVTLNKNLCVGCQSCVGFCPLEVMRKAPGVLTPFKCIACGKCVQACPEGALELIELELGEVERAVHAKHGRVCE